jgi:hypothetical protein
MNDDKMLMPQVVTPQETMVEEAAANLTEDEREAADLALRESVVKIEVMLRRKGGTHGRRQ